MGVVVVGGSPDSLNVCERVAFWEIIRVPLPENMSDAAAGQNLQAASTHPHTEGEFWRGTET